MSANLWGFLSLVKGNGALDKCRRYYSGPQTDLNGVALPQAYQGIIAALASLLDMKMKTNDEPSSRADWNSAR
ncbi:unnamed protein product [Caretta caretta]